MGRCSLADSCSDFSYCYDENLCIRFYDPLYEAWAQGRVRGGCSLDANIWKRHARITEMARAVKEGESDE